MRDDDGGVAVSEADESVRTLLRKRAVSVEFVELFTELCKDEALAAGMSEEEWTALRTEEMVHGKDKNGTDPDPAAWSIRGLTRAQGCTLVDLLKNEHGNELFEKLKARWVKRCPDQDHTLPKAEILTRWFGTTNFFVSHAWRMAWSKFREAVCDPRSSNMEPDEHRKLFFWCDIFAINQHSQDVTMSGLQRIKEQCNADLADIGAVVNKAEKGLILVFEPWNDPMVLGRAWCWHEVAEAISKGKNVVLGLSKPSFNAVDSILDAFQPSEASAGGATTENTERLLQLMNDLSAAKSTCQVAEDQERIHTKLRAIGGFAFSGADRRMKWAIALLLINAAKVRDKNGGKHNTGSAYGLLKKLVDRFEPCSRERAKLLFELSKQALTLGFNEEAFERAEEARNELTVHLDSLPVLTGTGLDEYRFECLRELAEAYIRIARTHCDKFTAESLEPAITNAKTAIDVLKVALSIKDLDSRVEKAARRRVESHESASSQQNESEGTKQMDRKHPEICRLFANANYIILRAISMHFETHASTTTLNFEEYAATARTAFEKAVEDKEGIEDQGETGAWYVLYGKLMDLMEKKGVRFDTLEDNVVAATKHFKEGIRIQRDNYGARDSRWRMSQQSLAFHYWTWEMYSDALAPVKEAEAGSPEGPGLADHVKDGSCPIQRLIYWINVAANICLGGRNQALAAGDAAAVCKWEAEILYVMERGIPHVRFFEASEKAAEMFRGAMPNELKTTAEWMRAESSPNDAVLALVGPDALAEIQTAKAALAAEFLAIDAVKKVLQ